MQRHFVVIGLLVSAVVTTYSCQTTTTTGETAPAAAAAKFGGVYDTELAWGEHLIQVGGCGDCHTPKKMGPKGPQFDSALTLSGHPAGMPAPPIDQKEAASKGLAATQTLTAWVGPWGISYAGNITSDSTGIGNWTLAQFTKAMREGKYKGLENSRPLMPPMPIEATMFFTDDELKAMFTYLKATKPIKNVVPAWQPPAK